MAKKKKRHVGLVVALVLVFVLIILPIGLAYALFFDTTTTSFVGDDNSDTNKLMNKRIVDGLASTKTTGKIDLALPENDINQLLYDAHKALPQEAKNFVKKFYCDISGKQYTFSFDAEVPLFKTRLRLVTTLDSYNDASGRGIAFTIDDVQLGRMPYLKGIATGIVSNFVTDESLTNMFASSGLNMKVSLSQGKITYARADYVADLKKMAGGQGNDLISNLLDVFFDNELTAFDSSSGIDVLFDLAKLHTNPGYCDPEHSLGIDVSDIVAKIKTLLDKGIVTQNEMDLGYVMNYLVRGYDMAIIQAQNYVQSRDFSSIGIQDVQAYKGANLKSNSNITNALKERINPSDVALGKIGYIDETDINDVLHATDAIGHGFVVDYVEGNKSAVACVCVDDFYANMFNGHLYLTVGLSINGYETSIVFDTDFQGIVDDAISLKVSSLYYGTLPLSSNLQSYFYDIVYKSLDAHAGISFQPNAGVFAVDLKQAIEKADDESKTAIILSMASGKELKASMTGSKLSDNGTIAITIE